MSDQNGNASGGGGDTSTVTVMADNAKKIIMLQLAAGVVVGAGFFLIEGPWEALSALYGGLVSVISISMLSRGITQAGRNTQQDAKTSLVLLYIGAAIRFVLVLVLFGIGLGVLKLAPLAMIAGFVITQLVFVLMAGRQGREKQ